MHHNTDGGWSLHACFDEVGDGNVDVTKLRRSEALRRGDALVEMGRDAAACPPDMKRPYVAAPADPSGDHRL